MEDMVLATEAMDMVSATDMEVMDTTTARGRPRLSPRLRLTLTSCMVDTTDMASATAMASATEATGMEAMDITTARGRLTPLWSLPLSATPMLPLLLSLPPSPSPTRPTPPPWRPTLLLPTLPSPLPSEATRLLPVTTVS